MGAQTILQVFQPPGVTAHPGTPNFLRDLSNSCYQAQWTGMTQGGAATAQFDCRQDYTDDVDIVFGDYVLFGNWGCTLDAPAHVGDTSITVSDLKSPLFADPNSFNDLQGGDLILITDGTNTEFFKIQGISGGGPTWSLALEAAGGVVLNLPIALLNNYAAGAKICRIVFYGYLTQRIHSTAFDDQFSINANGFFNRYGSFIDNATVTGKDGAAWMRKLLNQSAGQPYLTAGPGPGGSWPIGTSTFGCDDCNALQTGEEIQLDSESFTIAAVHAGAGTFDVTVASTASHAQGTVVLPQGLTSAPFLPDIVVDNDFLDASSVPVNIQASDETLAEIIAAVIRQETGSSKTLAYACWVDELRQVHHTTIPVVPPNYGQTKLTTHAPVGTGVSTPFHVANMTQIKVGRRVFISGAAGVDSLKVASINAAAGTFKTTTNSTVDHPVGDKVVSIYDVTPTFTISQSDNGSGYGDTINKIQTTDMDGSQLINAAIITGTVPSQDGQVETTLATPEPAGWGVFPNGFPCTSMPFSVGDVVNLSAGDEYGHLEQVTIESIVGDTFYTQAPSTKSHDSGSTIALASSAGPRIIIFEKDSIGRFGWFEGTISNDDIFTISALAQWGYRQIELVAWPVINTTIDLDACSGRITSRDLLGIVGFDDGIPFYVSISQIQYQWLAATQSTTASITAGYVKSTEGSVIKELNRRQAIRARHKSNRKKPTNTDGHMDGAECFPNSDNTFTINPATIKYGGKVFQTTSFAGTAPEGESWWGVDVSSGAAVIDLLPSVLFNGRLVYAEAIYQATDDDGVGPTLIDQFIGIPLWRIEVRNGVIQGVWPLYASNGVGLGNLPSAAGAPATPTFASTSQSVSPLANGLSCDLTVSTTIQNVPQDDQTYAVKCYLRTNGSTAWSHKATIKIPNLPQVSSPTLAISPVFHSLPNGAVVDVGCSFETPNGESPIGVIVSGFSLTTGLRVHPFGSTSGVIVAPANGALSGMSSNGHGGTSTVILYPTATALLLYSDVTPDASGEILEGIIGDTNNGFSLQIACASGVCSLYRYSAGLRSTLGSGGLVGFTVGQTLRLRLAVDFAQGLVEGVIEQYGVTAGVALLYTPQAPTGGFPSFAASIPITLCDSTGGASWTNLAIKPRDLFLAASLPYQKIVNPATEALIAGVLEGASVASGATFTSGSVAPSGSAVEGSLYFRTGGPPSLYGYNGSAWVVIF